MGNAATLAFMTAVTCYLLALVFSHANAGPGIGVEAAVYAVTAAFGLEFLLASWRSLWSRA